MQGTVAHGIDHQFQVPAVNAANNRYAKTQSGGQCLQLLQQLNAAAQPHHQQVCPVQAQLKFLQG